MPIGFNCGSGWAGNPLCFHNKAIFFYIYTYAAIIPLQIMNLLCWKNQHMYTLVSIPIQSKNNSIRRSRFGVCRIVIDETLGCSQSGQPKVNLLFGNDFSSHRWCHFPPIFQKKAAFPAEICVVEWFSLFKWHSKFCFPKFS